MVNNLRSLREGRSWSQDEAAAALGTTRNQYAKLEGGSRRLSDVWIARAAAAYGVDAGDVVTSRPATVPVVGYVGAGSEAHFAAAQGPLDEAPAPDDATPQTVAVEVRGDSLGTFFNGWLVYYDDRRSPITDDLVGRLCVVGLDDGRVLVKKVQRAKGGASDRFDLHGQFGDPVVDVAIAWAAPVKSFAPR